MRHAPPGDHSDDDVRDKPRGAGAAPKRQSRQPQTGTTTPRIVWRAAAQLVRSAAETGPRNMFRPVAETIMEDIREPADGSVAAPLANVLTDLALPKAALAVSLVSFNLGIEAGQLMIVAAFLPLAYLLRRSWLYPRLVLGAGSLSIVAVASVWLIERSLNISVFS